MIRWLMSVIYIISTLSLTAQSLQDYRVWFVDADGPNANIGGVDLDGQNRTVDYSDPVLVFSDGAVPSSLITGSDGKVYGTLDSGHIFRIEEDGSGYELVHALPGIVDGNPLLESPDGNFYGLTTTGKIYKAVPGVFEAQAIYTFSNPDDGLTPIGRLVEDADGVLYGLCRQGGTGSVFHPSNPFPNTNQAGTIFKVNKDGTGFTKLFDFNFLDGIRPISLILGSDGFLYGNTAEGGSYNKGVLFRVKTDGTEYTVINNFLLVTSYPGARGAISEYDEKLFGLTWSSEIYAVDLDGNNFTVIYDMDNDVPGESTKPNTLMFIDDKIYGISSLGGEANNGTIFRLDPDGNNYEDLFHFNGQNGNPNRNASFDQGRSLVKSTTGELLVAISGGGASNSGILFKLNSSLEPTVLKEYPFDARYPTSIFSFENELIGINTSGGDAGYGGIFSLSPLGDNHIDKFGFTDSHLLGAVSDAEHIYATQPSVEGGRLVKYSVSEDDLTVLINASDTPQEDLLGFITESGDQLFGVNAYGLYRVNKSGADFTVLKEFDISNEIFNYTTITVSNGFIYGVGINGGENGFGGIFKIDADGNNYEELYYGSTDFELYNSSLLVNDNVLIGALAYAGAGLKGNIFSMNTDGSEYKVITEFTGGEVGIRPFKLIRGPEQWLVGATTSGGANDFGTLFRVRLDGSGLSKLTDWELYPVDFVVREKLPQTITFQEVDSREISAASIPLVASSSEFLPVKFETTDTDKVNISGAAFTMIKPGRVSIDALGDSPYYKPDKVTRSFCIIPLKPTIAITGEGTPNPTLTSSAATGNQWYLNGEAIEGAAAATLNVTNHGTYTVRTTADDCPSELSDGRTILITGLVDEKSDLLVYPNPVQDNVRVVMEGVGTIHSLQLADLSGRTFNVVYQIDGNQANINASSLPKGIYVLRVNIGKNTRTIKILK